MENSQWHVVYTFPNFEKKIYNQLLQQNIDAYLPCQHVVRQWSDRKKKVEVPLFPNYVFVKVSKSEHFKVLSTNGVVRFISFCGIPAVMPKEDIEAIRLLINGNWKIDKEAYFAVGDRVKIIHGPLAGLEGIWLEKRGAKRFGIRFESIKQAVSIDIHSCYLEKISEVTSSVAYSPQ
jgi:transcription elongation factor/antiterminator RfaH